MEETQLLILKHWPEGQGLLGYSGVGDGELSLRLAEQVGAIFISFLFLFFLFAFTPLLFFFLPPPASTIFALPLCLTAASGHQLHTLLLPQPRPPTPPRAGLLRAPGALVFVSDLVIQFLWPPLGSLALEARVGACVLGPHRTVTVRETVLGRCHCRGALHRR